MLSNGKVPICDIQFLLGVGMTLWSTSHIRVNAGCMYVSCLKASESIETMFELFKQNKQNMELIRRRVYENKGIL
jgi:hypothetical protein